MDGWKTHVLNTEICRHSLWFYVHHHQVLYGLAVQQYYWASEHRSISRERFRPVTLLDTRITQRANSQQEDKHTDRCLHSSSRRHAVILQSQKFCNLKQATKQQDRATSNEQHARRRVRFWLWCGVWWWCEFMKRYKLGRNRQANERVWASTWATPTQQSVVLYRASLSPVTATHPVGLLLIGTVCPHFERVTMMLQPPEARGLAGVGAPGAGCLFRQGRLLSPQQTRCTPTRTLTLAIASTASWKPDRRGSRGFRAKMQGTTACRRLWRWESGPLEYVLRLVWYTIRTTAVPAFIGSTNPCYSYDKYFKYIHSPVHTRVCVNRVYLVYQVPGTGINYCNWTQPAVYPLRTRWYILVVEG